MEIQNDKGVPNFGKIKTLVIHPKDETTDFLSLIYSGSDWTVINDPLISDNELINQLNTHDRIIMLGHGTMWGLLTSQLSKNEVGYKYLINSEHTDILRKKKCAFIWCNADVFVSDYSLKGFYTGMIISEDPEALIYGLDVSLEDIEQSNLEFAIAIKQSIDCADMLGETKALYKSRKNKVILFNMDNLFQNDR